MGHGGGRLVSAQDRISLDWGPEGLVCASSGVSDFAHELGHIIQ